MSDEHMSDKDMDTVLREWTMDAPAGQPDRSRVVGDVVRQLGSTRRRRRRWWPARWFDRKPDELAVTEPTLIDPHPTAANSGHSPTVTGRTRSMLSPVKAITAGAVVFALGGLFLLAQPFDQEGGNVPGAATDAEAMAPALVTGSLEIDFTSGDFTNRGRSPDRVRQRYELTGETARAEMSDPRLDGSVTIDWMQDQHWTAEYPDLEGLDAYFVRNPGRAVLKWGTVRIENDTGAWEGTLLETFDVTADVLAGAGLNVGVVELVGSGAYDGLSAVLFMRDSNPEQTDETDETVPTDYTVAWNGIIFPGDLPPDR